MSTDALTIFYTAVVPGGRVCSGHDALTCVLGQKPELGNAQRARLQAGLGSSARERGVKLARQTLVGLTLQFCPHWLPIMNTHTHTTKLTNLNLWLSASQPGTHAHID